MNAHEGRKPFGCEECEKRFTTKGHLKDHMRIHTKEKPFSCHICNAKFSRNNTLKTHMRKHTGEKPYVCGECGKAFSESGNLGIHRRIHANKKSFVCRFPGCGKAFVTNCQRKSHEGSRKHKRGSDFFLESQEERSVTEAFEGDQEASFDLQQPQFISVKAELPDNEVAEKSFSVDCCADEQNLRMLEQLQEVVKK